MATAYLDGQPVFGLAVKFEGPLMVPRRSQRATYAGLDGVEHIDMGDAGMTSSVSGRLAGESPAALAAQMATLRSLCDGDVHDLTDTDGTVWPNVIMESADPDGPKEGDANLGYTQRFVCRFFHLTLG